MKNANVFIDVDMTLVGAKGQLFDGAREGLQKLRDSGCHLFLWSTVGQDYAEKIAALHDLKEFFEGYSAKPDIIVDDMPSTALEPFVFNVHDEDSWQAMADRIIDRHVD